MTGDLYLKPQGASEWKDAWTEYRANLEDGSVFELLSPQPKKEYVESNIRKVPGRIIRNYEQNDMRDINLVFHISASSRSSSYTLYDKFAREILAPGKFELKTRHTNYQYTLIYRSCTPISSTNGLIKFSLKLVDNCSRTNTTTT